MARACRQWIAPIASIGFFALLLHALKNPLYFDDGLRHMAMAKHMGEVGILRASWSDFVYEGILTQLRTDPWFLYHALLIPIGGLPVNLATDIVILAGIALLTASFLFAIAPTRLSVSAKSALVLLLLFGESTFTSRLFLARPVLIHVCISLLVLRFFQDGKPIRAAACIFVACLLSQMFVLPLFFAQCAIAWLLLTKKRTDAAHAVIAVTIAVAAALLAHPNAEDHVRYLTQVFLRIPFMNMADRGDELRGGIGRSLPILELVFVCASGAIFLLRNNGKTERAAMSQAVFTGLLAIGMLAGMIFWVRIIDFLWPVLLVFVAHVLSLDKNALNAVFNRIVASSRIRSSAALAICALVMLVWPRLRDFLWPLPIVAVAHMFHPKIFTAANGVGRRLLYGICLLVIVVLNTAFLLLWTLPHDASRSLDRFALPDSISAGSRVLNVDWSYSPIYFTLRPDLRFATAMDPAFLLLTKPDLAMHLHAANSSYFRSDAFAIDGDAWLRTVLLLTDAQYVLLETQSHGRLIAALEQTERVSRMESGEATAVFRINTAFEDETN